MAQSQAKFNFVFDEVDPFEKQTPRKTIRSQFCGIIDCSIDGRYIWKEYAN